MKNAVSGEKRKNTVLLVLSLIVYFLIFILVVHIYGIDGVTVLQKRILQNVTYLATFALTLVLMKCVKKPFSQFGLFAKRLPLQLLAGLALGGALTLAELIFGRAPSIPDHFLYILLSQALVALSEETFWRGFVLQTAKDITGSKDWAIFLSSLLFGLSHFPIGHSIAQVVFTFIIGAIFAALRLEFEDTMGIPALAVGHALSNIF